MKTAGALYNGSEIWRISTPMGVVLPIDIGHNSICATRPLFEWCVRQRIRALPGVRIMPEREVTALIPDSSHSAIKGVAVRRSQKPAEIEEISAALVVDASGRTSKAMKWLESLGYENPPEDQVTAGVGYSSRFYRIPDQASISWKNNIVIQPRPPHNPRLGLLQEVEGGLWQVVMGGSANHFPPKDDEGFLDWASKLSDPAIYDLIRTAEPVSPIYGFRIPRTFFRHYEKLSRWPSGFIVTGDAVCAFNPIYGQGMTVAALDAMVLEKVLRKSKKGDWEQEFQRKAAKEIANAWMMGTGEDLRWQEVSLNGKPADIPTRVLHRYMDLLQAAACTDPAVSKAFLSAIAMLIPPAALLQPPISMRVLLHALRGSKVPIEARQIAI